LPPNKVQILSGDRLSSSRIADIVQMNIEYKIKLVNAAHPPSPATASPKTTISHDQNFKELISTFFLEFLELFVPALATTIEPDSIRFLQQEYFADLVDGSEKIIDLLVEVRRSLPPPPPPERPRKPPSSSMSKPSPTAKPKSIAGCSTTSPAWIKII
jgi:hypothetical protein